MIDKRVVGFALILSAAIISGCQAATVEPTVTVGLANPASVYCEEQGYTLEMRTDADGGQYGVCIFPDGSECEEWAFYRGECHPASEAAVETPTPEPSQVPTEVSEGSEQVVEEVTETPAPAAERLALCWYGRVDSAPPDAAVEDYLVLLPEEARRAVDVVGVNEAVEAEIEALRDTGTYAHFWGTLDCDVSGWGSCRLVVDRLRPEGAEGSSFGPDPVEGWLGSVLSTPTSAQFDDYFVLAGSVPMRYGIESTDAAVSAQLESLRDTGAVVRVWGQVVCPAIDFQGAQLQAARIEVMMEGLPEEEGYAGWKVYSNPRFGYALRYPGDCTVMGDDLNDSVQFVGPLVDNEHWPVLTVSHTDCEFCHPPVGADVGEWLDGIGIAYDEIVEIAGLSMAHFRQEAGPGAYASDGYYFIRGEQLFFVSILHAGWQEDGELYNRFLQSITFP